ncbi:hypothetical protein [Alishewanella phage vB_AspM_Slickus01]|nr:hypothetical protein [Alishewanella phage vB_AspM_Slickus01]
MRQIALIDVDEVLVASGDLWLNWLLSKTDLCKVRDAALIEIISSNYNLPNAIKPHIYEDIDLFDFWYSDSLYDDLQPKKNAYYGLKRLKDAGFDLVIVSHVLGNHFQSKQKFIERHFGDLITGFVATSMKELVKGDLLIDDRLDYIKKCADAQPNQKQVLFNTRYKQTIEHTPHLIIDNWHEIDLVLDLF